MCAAFDAVVDGLKRADKVYHVSVNGEEELLADVVVVGIGAVPNVELAEAAGIIVSNGIVVDEFGRTSDPAVYAASDVTFHYNPLLRRILPLESWQNAQNQAFATAQTIAGSTRPYAELPWFWTDQYNCNLQIVGVPESWDVVVCRGDPTEGGFVAFVLDAGRIVGGCMVNSGRDMRLVKQLVLGERRFEPRTLRDTSKTLADFVRAA